MATITDDRLSAIALVAGTVATLGVAALHPTGRDLVAGHPHVVALNALVHGAGIAAMPVTFLGALGLTRRMAAPGRLAIAALVAYGVAVAAGLSAAVMSGFVAPDVLGEMAGAPLADRDLWRILFHYSGEINQAFAGVLVVASSIAILLWSAASGRRGILGRGTALYGVVMMAVIVVAVVSGHLRLGVHGFGIVVLVQSAWLILAAAALWRADGGRAAGPA